MAEPSNKEKWMISILAGILFYVIASPKFFIFIDNICYYLFGIRSAINGKPTNTGLFIHTVIFTLITRILIEN